MDLWIPKLDTESAFGRDALVQYLMDRGAVDAFNANTADFSRMADYPWFISDILQIAKIKTDEEGLEAAAVTMVIGHSSSYYSVMLEVECTNEQGAPETTTVHFGSTNPNSLPKVGDQLQVSHGLTSMVTHPNRDLIGVGNGAAGIGRLFLILLLLTMWRDRKRVRSLSQKSERNS